jgi:Ca-activated chloride channel family protein
MPRLLSVLPATVPALLLAGWVGLPDLPSLSSLPWSLHLPAWAERWMYNPRERTGTAIDAVEKGKPKEAVGPADTALRLAPKDPQARYNDGTAHLRAGDKRGAIPLLEKAAKDAGRSLAPAAYYNLGNAHLAAGDAAAAVEDYKQALRRAPHDADTKHNLEIALRERENEQRRLKSPREGSRGNREGEKGSSDHGGANDPADRQNRSQANDPGQSGQKKQDQQQGSGDQPQRTGPDGRPLPRFRDQPEMSAQEASALLQSVENLERQQRRQQAGQRARQHAAKGKDW